MKDFIIYDETGKILRTGSCPEDCFDEQANDETEFIIEGKANDELMYIRDGIVKDKSKDEIENELVQSRLKNNNLIIQSISKDMTDIQIDKTLNGLFLNKINIDTWKQDHYNLLRRLFYPDITEYIDAQVKIAKGGTIAIEGQDQLNEYVSKCYSIKLKFPKNNLEESEFSEQINTK